jgi:hypothetical protein
LDGKYLGAVCAVRRKLRFKATPSSGERQGHLYPIDDLLNTWMGGSNCIKHSTAETAGNFVKHQSGGFDLQEQEQRQDGVLVVG